MITDLNNRSKEILRLVVETYMGKGEPVGSRTISKILDRNLSPATIRNVLSDLEESGLLYAPHTSAGRLPTDAGLRLFIDGILEIGNLSSEEQQNIESQCTASGKSANLIMEKASNIMSGLSHCAGLVIAPSDNNNLKHIEFVNLSPGKALVVMVTESGQVENRIIELPIGVTSSALIEAGNYLAAKMLGNSLEVTKANIQAEIIGAKQELDILSAKVVEAGIATWSDINSDNGVLIVRGQANLLDNIQALSDLEHIRAIFSALERKESMLSLLKAAGAAGGVQIFIGAENELFNLSGCSLIIAPYKNSKEKIIGAIGVVGPIRMNYAKIIPMVDYTSKVVGKLIG